LKQSNLAIKLSEDSLRVLLEMGRAAQHVTTCGI
jgi:hypothetical protein